MKKSPNKNSPDEPNSLSFEQALEQVEQIVARLEEGQAGLSESLECYEQGVKLLRQCHEALAQAERKIEVLTGLDAAGNPVTEPLDAAEGESLEGESLEGESLEGESLEKRAAARSKRRSSSPPSSARRQPRSLTEEEIDSQDIPF